MDESSAQTHYLADALDQFATMRRLAERALAQVDDEQFFARLDPEANSLAILVKHVAGNLHSRWRDFLTTDGEKPDRDRDSEFVIVPGETRATLMARWDTGWATLSRPWSRSPARISCGPSPFAASSTQSSAPSIAN